MRGESQRPLNVPSLPLSGRGTWLRRVTSSVRRVWHRVRPHRHVGSCDGLFWFSSPSFLMWLFQLSYIENSMSLTLIMYGLVSE